MPVREFARDQAWLLPPSLDETVAADHPARFVAAFVDAIDPQAWAELTIEPGGDARGAPAYHPRLLLSVWLYGFMSGVRSSRKLEAACREYLPYLWLTAAQQPDHNTLWRFYQAHREGMRGLLRRTVHTAVQAGLVDLALQAVDGSKIAANASGWRTGDATMLARLLARTDEAIADLEAQNVTDETPVAPRLPGALTQAQALRDRVLQALAQIDEADGPRRVNLTDADARLLKAADGYVTGYNAQAMASPLTTGRGQLVTAAGIGQGNDQEQLAPMLAAAAANTGAAGATTLADSGYHAGANLAAGAARGQTLLIPDPHDHARSQPYHKDAFIYDAASDSYTCPEGQALSFSGTRHDRHGDTVRRYRARPTVCRTCPAFGACTRNGRHGRALEIGVHDAVLRQHRAHMHTDPAAVLYARRQVLIEPVFSVVKEQQGGRRFLLRGLQNVLAEWTLLLTAFNLRALCRFWRQGFLHPAA
jgi:transposase